MKDNVIDLDLMIGDEAKIRATLRSSCLVCRCKKSHVFNAVLKSYTMEPSFSGSARLLGVDSIVGRGAEITLVFVTNGPVEVREE